MSKADWRQRVNDPDVTLAARVWADPQAPAAVLADPPRRVLNHLLKDGPLLRAVMDNAAVPAACTARKVGYSYAAWVYSLISPLRIFRRRTRAAVRSATGESGTSVALGGRWRRPW
jgi:hypothetical protein